MQTVHAPPSETAAPRIPYERAVIGVIALFVTLRLYVAANWPLNFDELLYWRYSGHLAAGYLDHPILNPLFVRLGTTLFGDTALGVRFFAVLSALPATWAVWRAAALLCSSERAGATAALLFNLTVVMSVGSILATSDSIVVMTSALLLFALAKLHRTQAGPWWVVIGAVIGLGMNAKYTTAFLGIGAVLWVVAVPSMRRWLVKPWPYLGALIAVTMFIPIVWWNAEHHWASAVYQSSRMAVHEWSARYVLELIGSQIGLATPSVFILACIGLYWGARDKDLRAAWALLLFQIAPVLAYFLWHALHERVQGNWPECIYPALACSAALAVHLTASKSGVLTGWAKWSKRLAAPVAIAVAAIVYAQGLFGILPLRRDPIGRLLSYNWRPIGIEVERVRARIGAPVVLADDYTLASALPFYMHAPRALVQQISERVRWSNEPQPDAKLFTGPMLYVCRATCFRVGMLPPRYRTIQYIETLWSQRNGRRLERVQLYLLANPIGPALDPTYPVRVKGVHYDTL